MMKPKNAERDARKPSKAPPPPPPGPVAPLFRWLDWVALAITFGVVWTVYLLTLAPELTLEDSGELVTGAFYAGIPHPPGYPVWTIYSWLWTALLPIGNMAWRVSVGQAFSGAMACGLLALMVSRGSSMLMEGIEELKGMTGRWESAICLSSAISAGLLLGLDGFMWKESCVVNRIAVTSVPWFLTVLLCLMRWIYAPHQMRYAYWAAFLFGLCITLHQSLIVAALGIEIAIAAGNPRFGRDAFLGNFLVYLADSLLVIFTGDHMFHNIGARPGLLFLFNVIGIGSLVVSIWLWVRTKSPPGGYWKAVLTMGALWLLGVSFYLYMAVSGMTNPPMQWGYPRTVEGFFHAITRGQYEQPNPTNIIAEPLRFASQVGMLIEGVAAEFTWVYMFIALVPFVFFFKMQKRERAWIIALSGMYLCLGLLLNMLLNPSPDKASADLIKVFLCSSHTIVACLIGYGLALTAAFMATHYQKFRLWGLAGGIIGVVLALLCLWDSTGKHYFGPAGVVSLSELPRWIAQAFAPNQYGLPIFANLLLVAIALAFVLALVIYRQRGPLFITLGLFLCMPLYSGLDHWFSSDQRNHWFGYWFGHDMFTPPFQGADGKPIYPEMTKDAILYGGTDPGRFCPTYIIFCESFTPHHCQPKEDQKFDRRDVYIITQNALADGTYLMYIRAHYNRSAQYPLDSPFFKELCRMVLKDKEYKTNLLARAVAPLDRFFTALGDRVEKRRRTYTSWFADDHFTDLPALAAKLRPNPQQDPLSKYLHDNLSARTQQLLANPAEQAALRRNLANDLNGLLERELKLKKRYQEKKREKDAVDQEIADGSTSEKLRRKQETLGAELAELSKTGPLYEPERFKHVALSEYLTDFIKENPQYWTRIRLNRLLLEAAYPKEIARSKGGVYPDREMYIATPADSQQCFQEYMADAQRRMQAGQLKPGEDVKIVDNRVQVSGQVAVMNINGLLTKVMFDQNPKNEFFVEESFPLDWMYPHLTPFGIIMKINRQPLSSLTEDIFQRDHQFWKQFSKRLCGDIIDYDTPVKQITDWVEKTYLRRDFTGYTGDRRFVHDDDAQKSFSKLRSSIGGIYAWRLNPDPNVCKPEYRPKTNEEYQRVLKEADFAFRQAFAFCPYSPEAVFRYCQLLLQHRRYEDALLIAETCLKLDPYNGQVRGLVESIRTYKKQSAGIEQAQAAFAQLEDQVRKNPANFQAAFDLAGAYLQMQQTNRAVQVLQGVLDYPQADAGAFRGLIQAYSSFSERAGLQKTVDKLEAILRANPANAQAAVGLAEGYRHLQKPEAAMRALDQAFSDPKLDANAVLSIAQAYATLGNVAKLEASLDRLTKVMPENPEAWYDLAVLKAGLGKPAEALASLSQALELSAKRLKQDPKARDLLANARKEERFGMLRQTPEFKKLVPP